MADDTSTLPSTSARSTCAFQTHEPELEASPEKLPPHENVQFFGEDVNSTYESENTTNVTMPPTLNFDAYESIDEKVDADGDAANIFPASCTSDPNDSGYILGDCVEIALATRGQAVALQAEHKHDELAELVFNKFGNVLESCPQFPKTKLKRDEIREMYSNHDRHFLWSRACCKWHNGTGDPESKSDVFLKAMFIIHCICHPARQKAVKSHDSSCCENILLTHAKNKGSDGRALVTSGAQLAPSWEPKRGQTMQALG